jgi:2-polyprenyl-3-methyl-5-hydroxy-6-metoxy-1,4-benzoquinol methylase
MLPTEFTATPPGLFNLGAGCGAIVAAEASCPISRHRGDDAVGDLANSKVVVVHYNASMVDECCFCGTREFRPAFTKDGSRYGRCAGCSFLKNDSPSNANFDQDLEAYEPAYLEYLDNGPEDEAQFAGLRHWMEFCGAVAGARVLDVGCGSGKFVRYLRRQHFQAFGVEPANVLFERFLRSQEFFFGATLDEFVLSSGTAPRYDIVTALDVVEHVADPVSVIMRASTIMKPGGLLFLTTPDAGSLAARALGKHWPHYNKYHLSLMQIGHIKALAAKADLQIISIRRMARYKSVHYLVSYLLNFGFRSKRTVSLRQIADWVIPINTYDVFFACFRRPNVGQNI